MNPMIHLALACFGLSLILAYGMWVKARVWIYRQDLFAIRDDLWDQMRAKGQLDDPAHRDLRDNINSLIRLAPFISLLTLARIFVNRDDFGPLLAKEKSVPELDNARFAILVRTIHYLLMESLSGLVLRLLGRCLGASDLPNRLLHKWIGWLLDSKAFQEIDRGLSRAGTGELVHS